MNRIACALSISKYYWIKYFLAMIAIILPLLWPGALAMFLRHAGDNEAEAFSVALFQYMSVLFLILVFANGIHVRSGCRETTAQEKSRESSHRITVMRFLPFTAILELCVASCLIGISIILYDYYYGEMLAIPLFFFQTLPLTLTVVISAGAYRAGVIRISALILVSFSLSLLFVQFILNDLMLVLIFAAVPSMVIWWFLISLRAAASHGSKVNTSEQARFTR